MSETLEAYAKRATRTITNALGCGSEGFIRINGEFYVDPDFVARRIQEYRDAKLDAWQRLAARTKGE